MKTADIREKYLAFFKAVDHCVVPSSSLVPYEDPTLLFTNAGMNQFKNALLGREDLGYRRAVSAQKCVRAGGKHNDLENVGYTARHLTFFEMLGNFSFGDYFKEEAITWAWEFVTEVFSLPKDRLWVTVHPTDGESRALWTRKIGIPAARVVDHETNFWTMGDTGPCGPCTELFYDHGPSVIGGPPGSADEDGDRYIEFWNLVFPQFDRSADGALDPLPQPGVDTGMGLERMATVLQGVHSNFEIDLFRRLMLRAGELADIEGERAVLQNPSIRVIADHLRSGAFLIADGVTPGNEDRDYVLRRIIRRALRHGHKLNIRRPFLCRLVDALVAEMGAAYPQLVEKQKQVEMALAQEEERFERTLGRGMEVFEKTLKNIDGAVLPGDVVFKLYDTYGFPVDLTGDIARERGLSVDMVGFERAMGRQRDQARASAHFDFTLGQKIHTDSKVEFLGYRATSGTGTVRGLYAADGTRLDALATGLAGVVVLDRTPFYAEAGGQVGDTGTLANDGFCFEVQDTQRSADQHLHVGRVVTGRVQIGEHLRAEVDGERRRRVMANHSATHLMHAALRRVLGSHVNQMGSLVAADHLRFDFSHSQPVGGAELASIEAAVNEQVRANSEVAVTQMSFDDALATGAVALFGEKYGDEVRVLTMGDGYSVELCGGTHVRRTGDVGLFRIRAESGVAQGVRRIEAVTGAAALAQVSELDGLVRRLAERLKARPRDLEARVAALAGENRRLTKEVKMLTQRLASGFGADLVAGATDVNGIKVVAAEIEGNARAMMQTLDMLKSRLNPVVVVLAQQNKGKVNLVAGLSRDLTDQMRAPDLIRRVGDVVGARGGGSPVLARAGGGDRPEKLAEALAGVTGWVLDQTG